MFTGIVEELGAVESVEPLVDAARVTIRGPLVTADARPGESISVNGVCLTVVDVGDGLFTADVMAETLRRSSLGALAVSSPVNLERAARVDSRLGGHIVQGHVDAMASVRSIAPAEHWTVMAFDLAGDLMRYLVEKGSVTVDGVSLTVASVDDDGFTVSLIPMTLAHTTLGGLQVGDVANIEVDVIAKYVERIIGGRQL